MALTITAARYAHTPASLECSKWHLKCFVSENGFESQENELHANVWNCFHPIISHKQNGPQAMLMVSQKDNLQHKVIIYTLIWVFHIFEFPSSHWINEGSFYLKSTLGEFY